MSFVSRSGGEQQRRDAASGAPPADWEPSDPDAVTVHYDLSGWTDDQRAELTETLAEAELPHAWDVHELVHELMVPEAIEDRVDAVFEKLEERIGPFAVPLGADEPATEFGLDEWPVADIETLRLALVEAEIPHRWEATTVFVATDAEDIVDDLLDAIERGDIASFDEADEDGDAPDGALGTLYSISDRLTKNGTESSARFELFALMPQLDAHHPPFGVAVRSWSRVVESAQELVDAFSDATIDESNISGRARELRSITRPFV